MVCQHLHGLFHKIGCIHVLKAFPIGTLSATALAKQHHVVGVVRAGLAEGLVKGIAVKVSCIITFYTFRHIYGFHATPTAVYDSLFQMPVVHLTLYVLTISADFTCHTDCDFVRF